MSKILIVYYSRSGNTGKMADIIKEGVVSEGIDVEVKKVGYTTVNDLLSADGIIMGSPTYYGTMAYELKKLIASLSVGGFLPNWGAKTVLKKNCINFSYISDFFKRCSFFISALCSKCFARRIEITEIIIVMLAVTRVAAISELIPAKT